MSLFLDYKDIVPELERLSDRFDDIHKEFIENKPKLEIRDFTQQQKDYISKNHRGFPIQWDSYLNAKQTNSDVGWHMGGLTYQGIAHPFNAPTLPTLTETILSIPNILVAGLNFLYPGAELNWHNDRNYGGGATNAYRILWGLDVPVEEGRESIFQMMDKEGNIETQVFENNKFYAFDSNTTHRVENKMTKARIVMAMDVIPTRDLEKVKNKSNVMFNNVLGLGAIRL